ncbi:MAG: DUF2065 domain-containing protein [Caldimonas sp.]|jgi:uncharacterized protein YjeT (DUF2065 family)|uniref:DUF2065 domain-containing protein n=1 Tax=Caldimonas sp. TaxID=2838790 RepID=UPI00391989EF
MGEVILVALALVLVFEGLLPFVSPGTWRRVFEQALRLTDGQLRFLGLLSVGAGLLLLVLTG